MFSYLEVLLAGLIDDPVVLMFGAGTALAFTLMLGGMSGMTVKLVVSKLGLRPSAALLAFVAGLGAMTAGLAIGLTLNPDALAGISSWTTSGAAGLGVALGWWVGFELAGDERPPRVRMSVNFQNEGESGQFTVPVAHPVKRRA